MKTIYKTAPKVLGLVSGLFVGTAAFAQTECGSVDLLFNNFFPPNHAFLVGGMEPWANDVMRVTEGRVQVTFPAASLAPAPAQWNMVLDAIADVGVLVDPMESNRLHLPNIAGLPFVGNLGSARGVALWRTHEAFFAAANEFDGVHLLGHFANPGAGIVSGRPVSSIEDLSGMKLWTIGGPPAAIVEAIGAVPVPAPGEEMFNMFSRGIVDGLATNWGAMRVWDAYRYTEGYIDIPGGLYAVDFSFIMNQEKWDSICPADQAAITAISGETIARNVGAAVDEFDIVTQAEVAANNVAVIEPDAAFVAALVERTTYARDAWIARANARGVDGAAAIAFYLEQVALVTAEMGQ